MTDKKGTFYFFTGLAGAGKTTIGGLFYRRQKAKRNDILLFDGDATRNVSGERDYSTEGRLASFRRGIGMEKLITSQGVDLVACKIAMYREVYDWYRENIENYKLIYVRASMDTLLRRDQKKLYSSGAEQVVGVDLPFDEPEDADVIIDNDGQETPEEIVDRLEKLFGLTEV
jgi:adenylylsulfate kinase-like enzyme